MDEGKNKSDKGEHGVCHNPCTACNKKGYLDNEEICPACAGTGCVDKNTVNRQVDWDVRPKFRVITVSCQGTETVPLQFCHSRPRSGIQLQ